MREKVVVSRNKLDLKGYRWTSSLKSLNFDEVDVLLFHNTEDSDVDGLCALCKIEENQVSKLFYVNTSLHPLYYALFCELGADVYTEEYGLSDDMVLESMESTYGTCDWAVKDTLSDFDSLRTALAKLTEDTEDKESLEIFLTSENWKRTLNSTLQSMGTSLALSNNIAKELVPFIQNTQKQIYKLKTARDETNTELEQLVNKLSRMSEPRNIVTQYAAYRVPLVVPKVLYIREIGSCRFLISFLLAFQGYLKYNGIQSRLLLAHPNLKGNIGKYNHFTALSPDNIASQDINEKEDTSFVTLSPTPPVLTKFFAGSPSIKLYIVVDRMLGDQLVTSSKMHTLYTLYGVSGLRDIDNNELRSTQVIVPMTGREGNFIIPYFPDYWQSAPVKRTSLYTNNCKDMYTRLINLLELK